VRTSGERAWCPLPHCRLADTSPYVSSSVRFDQSAAWAIRGHSRSASPRENGFVASLARPGGNLTGLTQMAPELSGKRVELFKEAVPEMSRVGVLWHPGVLSDATGRIMLGETEAGARGARLQLQRFEAQGPDDFETHR